MDKHPLLLPFRECETGTKRFAVLLTCYMTGAPSGQNLGLAGYSYDFVAQLFIPLLARWGEVIPVPDPEQNLEAEASKARRRGLEPVHVSFLPFQDVCLAKSVPNVVVPAWEFPDVPNHEFDGNPQNNWVITANRCEMVLVGGPFTKRTFEKGGIEGPIRIVPVVTPDGYFALPAWDAARRTIDCPAYVFPPSRSIAAPVSRPEVEVEEERVSLKQLGKSLERSVRNASKLILGSGFHRRLTQRFENAFRSYKRRAKRAATRSRLRLPYPRCSSLELSGVVYTSIFNPDDGRKNWQDLLTGFLYALRDCEDATLVVKFITQSPSSVARIVNYYRGRDIPHRCKLAFVCDFLSDEQMHKLAEASTYYLQTTRAEGNCLPLMNYLAAGRPGISPAHSAIGDYFDDQMGYVVQSHPEPAAWPQDPRLRLRTSWGRLVWPSLVEQIRNSYEMAKNDRTAYDAVSARCRSKMLDWAGREAVAGRLQEALNELAGRTTEEAPGTPYSRVA